MLRGEKVLVACEVGDPALRQICRDRLSRDLEAKGVQPLAPPPGTRVYNDRELDGQLVEAASALDARALFVLPLTPVATVAGRPCRWASAASVSDAAVARMSASVCRSVADA
jgi:hypothetical protein